MRTIVLVSHDPSEKTVQFIQSLPGEVVVYQYGLHADHQAINQTVITTLRGIHKEVNLSSFGRVILTPPGMSTAVPLMVAGLLGITGAHPEILNIWRNSQTGVWEPVPGAEIVNSGVVYGVMRKERNKGQITQNGVLMKTTGPSGQALVSPMGVGQ